MPAFSYTALAADGSVRNGRLDADDAVTAQRAVEALGLVPTAVTVATTGGMLGSRVPQAQVLAFARSLGGLLAAGVPLSRALLVLEREASHAGAKAAWSAIHARVRDGDALAEAMAAQSGLFPPVFIAMVRAGEAGGFLGVVLDQVADYLEKSRELIGRVTSALVYPCLLAVIASAVVSFLLVWFIPRFATLFDSFHRQLPLITRIIQQASGFLVHYGWLLLLVIVVGVIAVRAAIAKPRGAEVWERIQLRLPVIRTVRSTLARVRFCRMLGTLLTAGVPLLTALKVSREAVGSVVLAEALTEATERIRQGTPMSEALRHDAPHPLVAMLPGTALEVLAVAEDSGQLPKELMRLADASERDLDRHLRTAVSLAEPLLLLLMAAIVGAIVVGMLMPIFDLWSAVS
jgi:type II secretory pathway component PulF